jgi:hypothetical protein
MDSVHVEWIVGRCLVSVKLNEPCQWVFSFMPRLVIEVECPWRLLKDGCLRISCEDHLQQYGLPAPLDAGAIATDLLHSQSITDVRIRDGTADLLIDFSDDFRLEVIPFSSGYENWSVTTPTGGQIIVQGGKLLLF